MADNVSIVTETVAMRINRMEGAEMNLGMLTLLVLGMIIPSAIIGWSAGYSYGHEMGRRAGWQEYFTTYHPGENK